MWFLTGTREREYIYGNSYADTHTTGYPLPKFYACNFHSFTIAADAFLYAEKKVADSEIPAHRSTLPN